MVASAFSLMSLHDYCRAVGSAREVVATPNSVYRPKTEPSHNPRLPDFADDPDRTVLPGFASRERNRDAFSLGFDASRDLFLARLDDVIVERWTWQGTECFRIFVDRSIALSEPYIAHYKAEWVNPRRPGGYWVRPGRQATLGASISRVPSRREGVSPMTMRVPAALAPLGFESVTMAGKPVVDQIDLFAEAEAIVLPHGAAGTNLAATRPGTLVVECHPPSLLNPTFWQVAQVLHQRYGLVVADPASGNESHSVHPSPDYLADMRIDPAKLLRVVTTGLQDDRREP